MFVTAFLSMWISNTATTLMLLPVILAVLDQAKDEKLTVALLLGVAYAASVGGMGTPVGTPPNVIFMGAYDEIVGKEISLEDVRLSLDKMPDRFHEHPATVLVVTNLYYSESPWLTTRSSAAASSFVWHECALEGDTAHECEL